MESTPLTSPPKSKKVKVLFLMVLVYNEYFFVYGFLMAIPLPPTRDTFRLRSQCHYSTDGGCFKFLLKGLIGKIPALFLCE